MRGRPRESKTWLRRACWTAGCPDMRQNPVGEPAATAALNFGTPRRRSSLKRLRPFCHCRQRYERLLSRVSGIGEGLARSIVDYREAHGPFRTRAVLKKVPRLGPKAFELSAGFLRIRDGDDPLDASGVHPEAYPVVRRILATTKRELDRLIGDAAILRQLQPEAFTDAVFGLPTVTDVLL